MSKNICSTMQVFHKKYERNLYVSIISGQSRELQQDPHSAQERRYLLDAGGFSEKTQIDAPGVLWLHVGGYLAGMKEMVHMSRAVDLVKNYGAAVFDAG